MAAPLRNVFRELDEMSRRLARIEEALAIKTAMEATPEEPVAITAPPTVTERIEAAATGAVSQTETPPPLPPLPQDMAAYRKVEIVQPPMMPMIAKRSAEFAQSRTPFQKYKTKGASPSFDLERLIGGRWYAVIGAVFAMIGIGLFLKLAYDKGWLGQIPGGFKCMFGAIFGMAMVGGGEYAFRKLEAGKSLAAAALSATGLGAMYASAYAARAVYDLVPIWACFVMLVLISALAITLAIRQKVATVGLLGLLGAYLAPFLMQTGTPSRVVMPLYLLVLLISGLILSARMGPRIRSFYSLRIMVWWGTVIIGTLWALSMKKVSPQMVLLWAPAVWVLIHAELVYWARSFAPAPASEAHDESLTMPVQIPWATARAFMTSFSSTAWCVLLGVGAVDAWAVMGGPLAGRDWMVPAAAAVATGAVGFVMSGHLRILKDLPRTMAERLGASLIVQCGSALIVALVLGLSGWAEPASLLFVGIGAAVAARWLQARSLNLYAAGAVLVGSIRVLSGFIGGSAVAFGAGNMAVSQEAALCGTAAVSWLAIAMLMRKSAADAWRNLYGACILGAVLFWTIGSFNCEAVICGIAMIGGAIGLAVGSRDITSFTLKYAAVWLIAAESGRILLSDYNALAGTDGAIVWSSNVMVPGLTLTFMWWAVLPLAAAAVWFLIADGATRLASVPVRSMLQFAERCLSVIAAAIGLLMIAASAAAPSTTASGFTAFWSVIAGAAALLGLKLPRYHLGMAAIPVVLLATVAWWVAWIGLDFHFDASGRWALLVHLGVVEAAALAAAYWWCGNTIWKNLKSLESMRAVRVFGGVCAGLLLFTATTMDAARIAGEVSAIETAQRAGVSIWWGICGMGLVAIGFARRESILRHVGLGLMGLAVGKAAIFDLAGVPAGWRVVSFLGLGGMMLAISVVYAKLGQKLGSSASRTEVP